MHRSPQPVKPKQPTRRLSRRGGVARFEQRLGPTARQASTVSRWLTSQGIEITSNTSHYIAVSVYGYAVTYTLGGRTCTSVESRVLTVGGFSSPTRSSVSR